MLGADWYEDMVAFQGAENLARKAKDG